jgi:hypothetical protein
LVPSACANTLIRSSSSIQPRSTTSGGTGRSPNARSSAEYLCSTGVDLAHPLLVARQLARELVQAPFDALEVAEDVREPPRAGGADEARAGQSLQVRPCIVRGGSHDRCDHPLQLEVDAGREREDRACRGQGIGGVLVQQLLGLPAQRLEAGGGERDAAMVAQHPICCRRDALLGEVVERPAAADDGQPSRVAEAALDRLAVRRGGQQQQPADAAAHHPRLQVRVAEDPQRDAVVVVDERGVPAHDVAVAMRLHHRGQVTDVPLDDPAPLDDRRRLGDGGTHPAGQQPTELVEAATTRDRAAVIVLDEEGDGEVVGQPAAVERGVRHRYWRDLGERRGERDGQRTDVRIQFGRIKHVQRRRRRRGHWLQLASHVLRQRLHQRGDQFGAEPRQVPVEALLPHPVQDRERDVDGDAVIDCAGVEAVRHRQDQVVLAPDVGEVLGERAPSGRVRGAVAQQRLDRQGQQLRIGGASGLPPLVEVAGRDDVGADALVVEPEHGVHIDQVDATQPVLHHPHLVEHLLVVLDEAVVGGPVVLDERVEDEHVRAPVVVDPVVADATTGHDGQPEQRHPLGGDGATAAGVPRRLGVRALGEVAAQPLGPLRLDRSSHPRPQPVRLDQLGRHDPLRRVLGERRPRADRELRPVRAAVVAPVVAPVVAGGAVTHADVREQARQQRLVDPVRVTRLDPARRPMLPAIWRSWLNRSCHSRTRR